MALSVTLLTEAPGVTVRATYEIASGVLTGLVLEQGMGAATLQLTSVVLRGPGQPAWRHEGGPGAPGSVTRPPRLGSRARRRGRVARRG